jgi:hypothetical protein
MGRIWPSGYTRAANQERLAADAVDMLSNKRRSKIGLAPWAFVQPRAILNKFNAAFFQNIKHAATMLFPHFVGDACSLAHESCYLQ